MLFQKLFRSIQSLVIGSLALLHDSPLSYTSPFLRSFDVPFGIALVKELVIDYVDRQVIFDVNERAGNWG